MSQSELDRRKFNQLALSAFGGIVAGSLPGCQQSPPAGKPGGSGTAATEDSTTIGDAAVSLLLTEPHVCRGLNTCKGTGASKDNACAGQGTCASVEHHQCGSQNACKGQGGCGAHPGENSCKGQGHCAVPLMDHAWGSARKNFEAAMQAAGKEFGPAPEAAPSS